MTYTDRHLKFEPGMAQRDGLRKMIYASIGFHVFLCILFPVLSLINPSPKVVSKTYLFDMVDVKPRARRAAAAAPKVKTPEPVKKAAPPAVVKKMEKAISTRKEAPAKEAAKKEEAAPVQPAEQTAEAPSSDARESTESTDNSLSNEMTIGKADFPYSYYGAQIRNAVEQNWRQTPQELLGSEAQLVVVVRFTIQKNGKVADLQITESSWNSLLDKLALRAIEKARIPPIPGEDQSLTITYRLVLRRAE